MFLCVCVRACVRLCVKSIMSRQPSQSHLLVLSGVSFFRPLQVLFFPLPSSLSFSVYLSAFHFSLISRIVYPPPQTRFPSRFRAAITTKHGAVTVRQVVLFPYMLRLSDSPAHLVLAASAIIHSRYMWRFLSVKFKKSSSFLLNFIHHLFQLYSWVFTIFYSCLTQREMGL